MESQILKVPARICVKQKRENHASKCPDLCNGGRRKCHNDRFLIDKRREKRYCDVLKTKFRQKEAVQKERSFLRSNFCTAGSRTIGILQGECARNPNKHSQRKPKTWKKVQNSKQVLIRKCDRSEKSPDHQKVSSK